MKGKGIMINLNCNFYKIDTDINSGNKKLIGILKNLSENSLPIPLNIIRTLYTIYDPK